MARENKEKEKKVIRFSVRLPVYQHTWLKARSQNTKGTSSYESMNEIIQEAIDNYIGMR